MEYVTNLICKCAPVIRRGLFVAWLGFGVDNGRYIKLVRERRWEAPGGFKGVRVIFQLELPMQCYTPVFGRPENYFNHWTICSWLQVSLNYCRAVRFCATSIARPFAPILRSGSPSHQCLFFGSFLGKPALQRFPIWINGLCSTDLGQSFGHLTNCGSIFFMLMIHLKTRNFQNVRSFGPCTSTISIDQRNIMSVTWTLTSHPMINVTSWASHEHPTPPHPMINVTSWASHER